MAYAKNLTWLLVVVALWFGNSFAQNTTTSSSADTIEADLAAVETGLNSLWLLICGFLVFFMQAGFAILGMHYIIYSLYLFIPSSLSFLSF